MVEGFRRRSGILSQHTSTGCIVQFSTNTFSLSFFGESAQRLLQADARPFFFILIDELDAAFGFVRRVCGQGLGSPELLSSPSTVAIVHRPRRVQPVPSGLCPGVLELRVFGWREQSSRTKFNGIEMA